MNGIITITTDFSSSDAYVGIMKGVILKIAAGVKLIDITQEIYPQDLFQAAFVIKSTYRWFPDETVHMVVVDPGVGSPRRRLAMRCGRHYFVGPDNGIFSYPLQDEGFSECVEIEVPSPSDIPGAATFEGRDVFAPAAARLASGVPLSEIGPRVEDPVRLEIPRPTVNGKAIMGRIIYIDHFGNCVSNIENQDIMSAANGANVTVGGLNIGPLRKAYSDVPRNDLLALVNSMGHVEIAVNHGSAARELNASVGSKVDILL